MSTEHNRPNAVEYVAYSYGRRLPDSMKQWVADDLAGKGATRRMMLRVLVPAVLVLAPFWLIPASFSVHAEMTLPILIPFIYFSHALNKVWRRHMLRKHNLDPDLVDYISRQKNAHVHEDYVRRYGPRPDSAKPSSHDI